MVSLLVGKHYIHAFTVATSKTLVTNGIEETMCRVLFLDDSTMELISSHDLELLETCFTCITVEFTTTDSSASASKEYFAVSTGYIINDEPDAEKGRILLFEVTMPARKVSLVVEREFKGAVYSLAAIGGRLAAGVGSKACRVYMWFLSFFLRGFRYKCSI